LKERGKGREGARREEARREEARREGSGREGERATRANKTDVLSVSIAQKHVPPGRRWSR